MSYSIAMTLLSKSSRWSLEHPTIKKVNIMRVRILTMFFFINLLNKYSLWSISCSAWDKNHPTPSTSLPPLPMRKGRENGLFGADSFMDGISYLCLGCWDILFTKIRDRDTVLLGTQMIRMTRINTDFFDLKSLCESVSSVISVFPKNRVPVYYFREQPTPLLIINSQASYSWMAGYFVVLR